MLKRRSFLAYFSSGWFASYFPIVLAACNPHKSMAQTPTSDRVETGDKDNPNPSFSKNLKISQSRVLSAI
jgi:cytochrome b6-f complex iron-sulfur subunit